MAKTTRVRSGGLTTRDVTREFTDAANALPVGVLVKDEYFTLYESVGALEMMDPKLDSGYVAPGETLDDEFDPLRQLSPSQIVGIMDQLTCQEAAWHMGSPLSQTLFTSLYLHRLLDRAQNSLEDIRFEGPGDGQEPGGSMICLVLRAYCVGLIKCCDLVHRMIGMQSCYEDEDFVTHLYNRNLLTSISEEEILQLLEEATKWLAKVDVAQPQEMKTALTHRLSLRKAFLESLAHALRPTVSAEWAKCNELLESVRSTARLGSWVPAAFSAKLQRKLASTVPPRPMVTLDLPSALAFFQRLCQDSYDVHALQKPYGSNELKAFIWIVQLRKPQPTVYVRALLQSRVAEPVDHKVRQAIMKQLLFDDLAEIVLPADVLLDERNADVELPGDPRFEMVKGMDDFASRACQPYDDFFRLMCQNRSRARRLLTHGIVCWDNLQFDAEDMDAELRRHTREEPTSLPGQLQGAEGQTFAFPLSSWVYYHKLRQMEWIVQLGFELDVYQPDELAQMYWYLHHLLQTRITHLERIRWFLIRKLPGNVGLVGEDAPVEVGKAAAYIDFLMGEAAAYQDFAYGMFCLYTVLLRLRLITAPPRPYSSDALRYEVRFRPLLAVDLPDRIPFEQYRSYVEMSDEPTSAVLLCSVSSISSARKGLERLSKLDGAAMEKSHVRLCADEWKDDVKNALRACIATSLVLSTLEKALTPDVLNLFFALSLDDDGDAGVDKDDGATEGDRPREQRRRGVEVVPDGADGVNGVDNNSTKRVVQELQDRVRLKVNVKGNSAAREAGEKVYHDWWIIPCVTRLAET